MSGKYDIGDEFVLRIEMKDEDKGRQYYTTNNGLLLTEGYFDKLEQLEEDPMTEADWWSYGWSEGYGSGLVDAWAAARKIACEIGDGGFGITELEEIYGTTSFCRILRENTASEAMTKIREYEEKKAESEIKVGDEVELPGGKDSFCRFFVTRITRDRVAGTASDGRWAACDKREARKTGRHFPQIAEVMEQMKDEYTETTD